VGERHQERSLEQNRFADPVLIASVGTQDLHHAAAVALEAVYVVGVEASTVAQQ